MNLNELNPKSLEKGAMWDDQIEYIWVWNEKLGLNIIKLHDNVKAPYHVKLLESLGWLKKVRFDEVARGYIMFSRVASDEGEWRIRAYETDNRYLGVFALLSKYGISLDTYVDEIQGIGY